MSVAVMWSTMLRSSRLLDDDEVEVLLNVDVEEKLVVVVTGVDVEVLDDEAFHLSFDAPPRFEMDGDVRRAKEKTVDVRVLRDALRVVGPRK